MTASRFESGLRRTILPNGLTVVSEHMPGVRSIAFGAWVRAASVHEPRERMGVSHLLEHMVFKGTPRRSARQIALALEAVGGSLDAYTAREHTVFQARVLDEHLPIAADVIADLVFRPLLRAEDLAVERKVVLEEISMVEDTPDDLVFELHNEILWGEHPYGYSILGTRRTVSEMGVADLRSLHERAYHPNQLVVAVSGSVDHDELLESLEKTGWLERPAGPMAIEAPALPNDVAPTRRHMDREGVQTHVVYGSRSPGYGDPRRYALSLVSHLLGGGMSSTLFQRVREELGLAYSVYTYQSLHADVGIHGIYIGTAPDAVVPACEAVDAELARLAADGLSDEDLESGKQQLKGQVTLSMESVSARMYKAAVPELYGEPYRTLDETLALVDAISPEVVREVCAEFFRPEQQTVLSLGPAGIAA